MNPLVLIPARMAATRLPGKPLALIDGRPMILHVLERAREAGIGPVAAAVCDEEVAAVVREAGFQPVMTDPELASGSDRVHAAARLLDPDGAHDVVVNLQGDLPAIEAAYLQQVLTPLADLAAGYDIATLVSPATEEEVPLSSVVKAACAFSPGTAIATGLYFSRAPIPWGDGPIWHHIGVYAWRRAALARFVSLPESAIEQRERLEQLRAIEAGLRIGCARVAEAPLGVDTEADLVRVRQRLETAPPGGTPR